MLLVSLSKNKDDRNKKIKKVLLGLMSVIIELLMLPYRVSVIGESLLANLLAITYLRGKVSSR